jgi:hypothetical protein
MYSYLTFLESRSGPVRTVAERRENSPQTCSLSRAKFDRVNCKILHKFVPIRAARKIHVLLVQEMWEWCFMKNLPNYFLQICHQSLDSRPATRKDRPILLSKTCLNCCPHNFHVKALFTRKS